MLYYFINNELQIQNQELHPKVSKCRDKILESCLDLPCTVLDASLTLNYPPNVSNSFATLLFYYYSFDESNQFLLPALRLFLHQQYCSSSLVTESTNENRKSYVDQKLTKLAQLPKTINNLSQFQGGFSDACSDFIEKLVKNKFDIPPPLSGPAHMIG